MYFHVKQLYECYRDTGEVCAFLWNGDILSWEEKHGETFVSVENCSIKELIKEFSISSFMPVSATRPVVVDIHYLGRHTQITIA